MLPPKVAEMHAQMVPKTTLEILGANIIYPSKINFIKFKKATFCGKILLNNTIYGIFFVVCDKLVVVF